eukprot:11930721-Karenia_brevis.AAC.1
MESNPDTYDHHLRDRDMFIVSGARPVNGYKILHFKDKPCDQLNATQLAKTENARLCKRCWRNIAKSIIGDHF